MPFTIFARQKPRSRKPQPAALPPEVSPVPARSQPVTCSRPTVPSTNQSSKVPLVLRDLATSASSASTASSSSFPSASSSLSSPSLVSSSSRATSISSSPSLTSRSPLSLTSPPLTASHSASHATPHAASLPESTSPSTSPSKSSSASQTAQLPELESRSSASSTTPLISLSEARISPREDPVGMCAGERAERSSSASRALDGELDGERDGVFASNSCGRGDASTATDSVCDNVRSTDGNQPAEDENLQETVSRRISISKIGRRHSSGSSAPGSSGLRSNGFVRSSSVSSTASSESSSDNGDSSSSSTSGSSDRGSGGKSLFRLPASRWPAVSPASLFLRLAQTRFISAGLRPLRIDLDASTYIRCWLPAPAAAAAATAAAASRRHAQQQARWERNPPLLLLHGFGGPGHLPVTSSGDGAHPHDGSEEGRCGSDAEAGSGGGSVGDAATVHWHQLVGSLARDFELYVPNLVWFGESGVEGCGEWGGTGGEGVGGREEGMVEEGDQGEEVKGETEEEEREGKEENEEEEVERESRRDASSKYSIQFQADCMMRLTRILGLTRFDVLGFGYGASIAYRMAAQHPGIIRRVILTSPMTMMTQQDLEATLQPHCTNSKHPRRSSSSIDGHSSINSSSISRRRKSCDGVMKHTVRSDGAASTAAAAAASAAVTTAAASAAAAVQSAPSSPRLPSTVAELRRAQHAAFEGAFWAPAFVYRDLLKVLFSGNRSQQQRCLDEFISDRPQDRTLNPVLKQEVLIVCGRKDPIAPLPFGKMLLQ
ncbi:hypothetical protein CLOP_g16673 [Closterium sp. NIES-67]|nr:hypothetical protein CLOP_g16673 [Closterium sp. NIES-67]